MNKNVDIDMDKESIKVVHVVRSSLGGAGIAAVRLNDSLNRLGMQSTIICCDKDSNGQNRIVLGKGGLILRANRWIENKFTLSRRRHTDYPFNCSYCGYNLSRYELIRNADVIHLHWVCQALTIKEVACLCKLNKPIIWTCHDLWPFTGGCHYQFDDPCPNYDRECMDCVLLKPGSKIAHRNLIKKQRFIKDKHISFIAPSKWMEGMLRHSIFGKDNISLITNVVDGQLFRPYEEHLDFSDDNSINVLFATASSNITYKGFSYLEKMLEKLADECPEIAKRVVINILGNHDGQSLVLNKFRHKLWGFVREEKQMARIYSSCDLLAYPSYEDNLPSVVMESLLCETPVLAFNTGGIPDMVEHMKSGYVARYRDADDFYEGLLWIINNNDNNILGKTGRIKGLEMCDGNRVAKMHRELYLREMDYFRNYNANKG